MRLACGRNTGVIKQVPVAVIAIDCMCSVVATTQRPGMIRHGDAAICMESRVPEEGRLWIHVRPDIKVPQRKPDAHRYFTASHEGKVKAFEMYDEYARRSVQGSALSAGLVLAAARAVTCIIP